MSKSVSIIGAGIAGLSVGCYLQMNGYQTQIFEMHDKAGGLCTAWQRKGYNVDGCLQWLWGSSPNHEAYKFWEELGAIQGKQIINLEELMRIETLDGKSFSLYTNADRLEQEMKNLDPEDSEFIHDFAEAIRRFASLRMPVDKNPELYTAVDYLKMSKFAFTMRSFNRWKITISEFAQQFKNPGMRSFWQQVWEPNMSVLNMIMQLASTHNKSSGYPIGGSLPIVQSIEKRYANLGGKINFKDRINKIIVENNRSVGLRLANGSEVKSDCVISAADGHETIFEMLEGKFFDDKVQEYYSQFPVFTPLVYVGLGVNRSFEDTPKIISGIKFELQKSIKIGDS